MDKSVNHNEGKLRYSRIFIDTPHALEQEARVAEHGEKEYERFNWVKSFNTEHEKEFVEENMDSIARHFFDYSAGQNMDLKSMCHHLAHVRRRCAFLIEYYFRKMKV